MASQGLLSLHKTVATFGGINERKCFARTAGCPDQCNHGGEFAKFSIKKYLHYEKLGKYGDGKTEEYYVRVNDDAELNGLTLERKSVLDGLKVGDYVLLSWNHDYVNRNKVSSPERPITELIKISKEEANKM